MDDNDNGRTPEAKADKRKRFDTLPSPEVSGAEARSIPRGGGNYAIRQDNNGRRYYDHSLTKMEALDSLNTSTNMDVHRTRASTSPAAVHPVGKEPLSNILKKHLDINNIGDSAEKVNREDKEN